MLRSFFLYNGFEVWRGLLRSLCLFCILMLCYARWNYGVIFDHPPRFMFQLSGRWCEFWKVMHCSIKVKHCLMHAMGRVANSHVKTWCSFSNLVLRGVAPFSFLFYFWFCSGGGCFVLVVSSFTGGVPWHPVVRLVAILCLFGRSSLLLCFTNVRRNPSPVWFRRGRDPPNVWQKDETALETNFCQDSSTLHALRASW